MFEFLRLLPKAELHVHLEGSVTPETLAELQPGLRREEILSHYRYNDFHSFLMAYKWVNSHIRSPEHYALIMRRLLESLEQQGVVHAEINLSIGVLLRRGLPFDEFFAAIEVEAACAAMPVRLIFDAVRQFGTDAAEVVAGLAVEHRHRRVAAFGIGGDESSASLLEFRGVLDSVKQAGIRVVPHAGEVTNARSVWEAVECGADRIGHGIRAAEDPALMAELRDRGIPLEISISSNLATRAVPSLSAHPVRRLFDAGVPVVLNTDDPPMFNCTLLGEYELAARSFGFTRPELESLAEASLRHAFR